MGRQQQTTVCPCRRALSDQMNNLHERPLPFLIDQWRNFAETLGQNPYPGTPADFLQAVEVRSTIEREINEIGPALPTAQLVQIREADNVFRAAVVQAAVPLVQSAPQGWHKFAPAQIDPQVQPDWQPFLNKS